MGIYDPAKLAEIDFLNKPEQLVELVSGSRSRKSRAGKMDMLLLTDITTKWMQYMVDRQFPPLTPHHTQAFTVLMMASFYRDHLTASKDKTTQKSKKGLKALKLKAFVAQFATG